MGNNRYIGYPGFAAMTFYNFLQLGERSRLMLVSSPYHVRLTSYKNFNQAQVNTHVVQYIAWIDEVAGSIKGFLQSFT